MVKANQDGHQGGSALGASVDDGWRVLRGGADLFDAGQHHASHESFEAAWLAARRGEREGEALWWQGLVLCAGALHHRGKGNQTGARALSQRALDRFGSALRLAENAAGERAWWVAPCEEWREGWYRVNLGGVGKDGAPSAAADDPRLGGLLERYRGAGTDSDSGTDTDPGAAD
ncbi:MAG: hypothetical protein ACJA2W_002127 [Planctomycetota bacterium]|jgi:hypothetical protein